MTTTPETATWQEVIIQVLGESSEPLHYKEITEQIISRGLRTIQGATPDATVAAQIFGSIKHKGEQSPYLQVGKGLFTLRVMPAKPTTATKKAQSSKPITESDENSSRVIQAFGIFWQRDLVLWKNKAKLFGSQQIGTQSVDFGGQVGIYVLYDHHTVVYVGRSIDRPLGQRLYEHTVDRLSSRWDRFSWFGLDAVTNEGALVKKTEALALDVVITALEAILIETLEPPQNRRRGDDFNGVEYVQAVDPELKEQNIQKTLREIASKMRDAS
jgi:hypothetical protein